uniref:Small integral membrane protein 14 n=1 Tax=Panagrolaimus sp. JU765 TaxID=591449 RepID=A0AC34RFI9_9BILA
MSGVCHFVVDTASLMAQILTMIRNNQENCDESTCVIDDATRTGSVLNMFFFMAILAIFAVLMFRTRPNSLRSDPNEKPRSNSRRDPPSPPVM